MITIYGKPACGFCEKAKQLADVTGISYTYINLERDSKMLSKIKEDGFTTIPAIYDDDRIVGGFVEFKKEMIGDGFLLT